LAAESLDGLDDVKTVNNLTKDNVFAVEPCGLGSADEKLGAVGVGSSIGHGQSTSSVVLYRKVRSGA
jgi:hypothetical protein